jgi:hypothetical protein
VFAPGHHASDEAVIGVNAHFHEYGRARNAVKHGSFAVLIVIVIAIRVEKVL